MTLFLARTSVKTHFKMYRTAVLFLVLATAFCAEIPKTYDFLEKHAVFKPELQSEPVVTHAILKKEAKVEMEHPVYRAEEFTNEGRARIEPVRSRGPVVKHDAMLADQPPIANAAEVNRVDDMGVLSNGYIPGTADVAYPDIPYAPGYGYDTRYASSNNYDLYDPYLIEPDTSTFGLLWSQVPDSRTMVSYVGRTISWVFSSIFVLLLGSLLTIGVCSYTNLCSIHFHGIGPIHEEMRALMSPERLEKISTAADFVKNAIDKYQKIQKVTDGSGIRTRRATFYG